MAHGQISGCSHQSPRSRCNVHSTRMQLQHPSAGWPPGCLPRSTPMACLKSGDQPARSNAAARLHRATAPQRGAHSSARHGATTQFSRRQAPIVSPSDVTLHVELGRGEGRACRQHWGSPRCPCKGPLAQSVGRAAAAMHWPTALKWSSAVWNWMWAYSGNSVSSTVFATSNMRSPPFPLLTRPRIMT